jgi:maleylpyruvate isomerase
MAEPKSRDRGPDVQAAIEALRDATARLEAAVDRCRADGGHEAFAGPSRLPGWTIGHVVTHLARNADGLRRVLVGARVGERLQPYDSPQARSADIERGATRSTDTIAVDLATADRHLAQTIDTLPQTTWAAIVDLGRGGPATADVVVAARLAEVELHHADLGVDAGLDLLAEDQAEALLQALQHSYVRTREVPPMTLAPGGSPPIDIRGGGPVVTGSAPELVRWLSGRGAAGVRSERPLPDLPGW